MKQKQLSRERGSKRTPVVFAVLALLLFAGFLLSINAGYTSFSLGDTFRILFGGGDDKDNLVLFSFRMPRIVISILIGVGFAVSGCVVQGVVQNPLADPGLLGINAGASLMAVLYVVLVGAGSAFSVFTMPLLALLGGLLSAGLIFLLSRKKGEGILPMRMVMSGLALQAGISALTTVLVIGLDDSQFDFVTKWNAGSIWGANWKYVLALLPWLLIVLPYVFSKSRELDIMALGDDAATGLGVKLSKERRGLLLAAVALASTSVAVSGSIGFVGLIAPHLARRLVGTRHRALLPCCALLGGLLVLAADMVGRVMAQPSEIPAGIVVAAIGAPYFLYLLMKN